MKQFTWERNRSGSQAINAWMLGETLGVKYENLGNYEKSWEVYASKVIDALSTWCEDCGIKYFGAGHTQIAIQITFADNKDAMLFKLRWHNA